MLILNWPASTEKSLHATCMPTNRIYECIFQNIDFVNKRTYIIIMHLCSNFHCFRYASDAELRIVFYQNFDHPTFLMKNYLQTHFNKSILIFKLYIVFNQNINVFEYLLHPVCLKRFILIFFIILLCVVWTDDACFDFSFVIFSFSHYRVIGTSFAQN